MIFIYNIIKKKEINKVKNYVFKKNSFKKLKNWYFKVLSIISHKLIFAYEIWKTKDKFFSLLENNYKIFISIHMLK